MSEINHNTILTPPSQVDRGKPSTKHESNVVDNVKDLNAESLIEMVDNIFPMSPNDDNTLPEKEDLRSINDSDEDDLNDEERMLLYDKAMHFKRLGSLHHALLCFLGCLQGLQPSSKSKFTMLPQCLTHVAEIYAHSEDYQRAVEFMQAAKLYYEIAIIETGIQVDEYKKETDSGYRPLDLDPCLDEAKRANEYEKLSYSCLEHKKFQLALDYCGKATKLRQQVYGDDDPITGKSLDLFTLIYAEMGKCQYGEALQKYGDLTKVIEEEKLENKVEPRKTAEEQVVEHVMEPVKEEATNTSHVESSSVPANESEDRTEIIEDTPEKIEEPGNDDNSAENQAATEEITSTNEEIENTDGESVKLITPFQLLIIFIISAFLSVFLTGMWCYISESDSCPSKHYMYATLRYWYYFYIVPPATDEKFY